ncbi:MAG TPA: DUF5666 domain-containing protein [Anaerolineales bacterium]|nr:DUF5666 domain-containing protein [Anaerolineales bacterium]
MLFRPTIALTLIPGLEEKMRIRPRLLGLALAAMVAVTVPAFAAAGVAGLYALGDLATPETILEFSGEVISIGPDSWTVGEQTFAITPETEIEGSPRVGDFVSIHAVQNPDGSLRALEIELEDDGATEDPDEGEVDEGNGGDVDDDDVEDAEEESLDDDDAEDGDDDDAEDGDDEDSDDDGDDDDGDDDDSDDDDGDDDGSDDDDSDEEDD